MEQIEAEEVFHNIPFASSVEDCKKLVKPGVVKSFASWFSVGQIPASSFQFEMAEQDYSCTSEIMRSVFDMDKLREERNKPKQAVVEAESKVVDSVVQDKPAITVKVPDPVVVEEIVVKEDAEEVIEVKVIEVKPVAVEEVKISEEVKPVELVVKPVDEPQPVLDSISSNNINSKTAKDDSRRKVRFSADDEGEDKFEPISTPAKPPSSNARADMVKDEPADVTSVIDSNSIQPIAFIQPTIQPQQRSISVSMDRIEFDVASIAKKRHELFLPPSIQLSVQVKLSSFSDWEVYEIVLANAVINGKKKGKSHFVPICSIRNSDGIVFSRFDCKAGFIIIVNDAFSFKPDTVKDLLMIGAVMKQAADSASGVLASVESKQERAEPNDWVASYRKDRQSKKNKP